MRLSRLLAALAGAHVVGRQDPEVTRLDYDSRQVEAGSLFVAISGFRQDGHAFIGDALARGAVAVVAQADHLSSGASFPVPLVLVPHSRRALAELAAAFHGYPARKLKVIGVTGTNGKTTIHRAVQRIERLGYTVILQAA